MTSLVELRKELKKIADPKTAAKAKRFFKSGKGEYGEGDQFIGVSVPQLRKLVRTYHSLTLNSTLKLLRSKFHEERLLAVFILVYKFKRGTQQEQEEIYSAYMKNTKFINNWDIVDSSAYFIVGPYLQEKSKKALRTLSRSNSLWERRIAMVATYHYIKQDQFKETLAIAKILLKDDEDLIHKAVGWMLRETGNRDKNVEIAFLKSHYKVMPRTMLRYAIEKFTSTERKAYLQGLV